MKQSKNRRTTPKGIMERVTGKKMESNILPAAHKVLIMEYLLSCPISEIAKYNDISLPTFIYECATLLNEDRIGEYITILNQCRTMAREDAEKTAL